MFFRAYASGSIRDFQKRLLDNMLRLKDETGLSELAVPVGIFLVLDRDNGGNDVGDELIRRFNLLDAESRDVIDFFFLGWARPQGDSAPLTFNLAAFQSSRDALHAAGIGDFGGYADLFLFDAWLRGDRIVLDFEKALHIDLAEAIAAKRFANIGGFLEGLVRAAHALRQDAVLPSGAVIRISDKLGLATAKQSVLDFFLDKWGKVIGATSLLPLATRRVGPSVDLADI
jgi:hypothetical protein